MAVICGVDGCKAGWIAVYKDLDSGVISKHVFSSADKLIGCQPRPGIIAIDIPIGLPDSGPRACDLEARQLLGPGRASSIFPAPIRPILAAASYEEACSIRFNAECKKISIQTWHIMKKIREVDDVLCANMELRALVHEMHPEVSFYYLASRNPMKYSKKTKQGRDERRALLEPIFGHWLDDVLEQRDKHVCEKDDVLDAFAGLWTAERILSGKEITIPAVPPQDSKGLDMKIAA